MITAVLSDGWILLTSLSLIRNQQSRRVGAADRVESSIGGGVGSLERVIFFSSGVKGGRSCVQSSWQKALLCAAYADSGGSFVHRWRSHAWVCLRQGGRGKGGRRGEFGEGKEGEGGSTVSGIECHHYLLGGGGTGKGNRTTVVHSGSTVS